MYNELVLGFG